MKKRLFYGVTLFAMLFTSVAWQYASDELVELDKKPELTQQDRDDEA